MINNTVHCTTITFQQRNRKKILNENHKNQWQDESLSALIRHSKNSKRAFGFWKPNKKENEGLQIQNLHYINVMSDCMSEIHFLAQCLVPHRIDFNPHPL